MPGSLDAAVRLRTLPIQTLMLVLIHAVTSWMPASNANAAPGDLDTTFGGGTGKVTTNLGGTDAAYSVALQTDGKIVVAGTSNASGSDDIMVTRYLEDGTLDASFGTGGTVLTDLSGAGSADLGRRLAIQPDGKIVVVGETDAGTGGLNYALVRYMPDGTLDSSFGTTGLVVLDGGSSLNDGLSSIVIQPDGKLVVSGYSAALGVTLRFLASGALDTSFASGGTFTSSSINWNFDVALDTSGRILVAGWDQEPIFKGYLMRLTANGSPDSSFNGGQPVQADFSAGESTWFLSVNVQSDGKIIAGGRLIIGPADFLLARYLDDGTLDTSFGTAGNTTTDRAGKYDDIIDIAIDAHERIIAAGLQQDAAGVELFGINRYTRDGILDTTFGTGGRVLTSFGGVTGNRASGVAITTNGRLVVAGNAGNHIAVVSYEGGPTAPEIVVTGNGTLIADGDVTPSTTDHTDFSSASILGGSVARTFTIMNSGTGNLTLTGTAPDYVTLSGARAKHFSVTTQPASGTVTSGGTQTFVVTYDPSAAGAHTATVSIASDDVDESPFMFDIAGYAVEWSDGTLDGSFATGGIARTNVQNSSGGDQGYAISIQADDKIVLAGSSDNGSSRDFAVARYLADGGPDGSFGTGGSVVTPLSSGDDEAYGVAMQADGRIVAVGRRWDGGVPHFAVVRYLPNGTLDGDFGSGGIVTTALSTSHDTARGAAVQPDGKILVAGYVTTSGSSDTNFAVVRYLSDGGLDPDFGSGGVVTVSYSSGSDVAYSVAVQPDGKIVVGGYAVLSGRTHVAVARLLEDGSLDPGFGTGGRATVAVGSSHADGYALALQDDGKIVVTGRAFNGSNNDVVLVRLSSSGSVDGGFGTGGIVQTPVGTGHEYGQSVDVQGDGRIVVGGYTRTATAGDDFLLLRYLSDGTLDGGFGTGGIVITTVSANGSDVASAVAVQRDGGIVLGGWAYDGSDDQEFAVARYTVSGMVLEPEIAVFDGVGTSGAERTDNMGTVDLGGVNVGSSSGAQTFTIRNVGGADLVGLSVTKSGANAADFAIDTSSMITALPPGGSTTFSVTFVPGTLGNRSGSLQIISNDADENPFDIALSGTGTGIQSFTFNSGTDVPVTTNGYVATGNTLDLSLGFAPSPFPVLTLVNNTSASPITGTFTNLAQGQTVTLGFGGTDYRFFANYSGGDGNDLVLVLLGPGIIDPSFSSSANDDVYGMAVQADGKIVVVGEFTSVAGIARNRIARLSSDGSVDTDFNPNANGMLRCVVTQPDGKLVIGGTFTGVGGQVRNRIARLNADGSLDTGFNPNASGTVTTLALQPDGKLIATGFFNTIGGGTRSLIARLNPDGTLDAGFTPTPDNDVTSVAVQADGKILIGGNFSNVNGIARNRLARLSENGTLDMAFNPDGSGEIRCLVVQPDGKIIVTGNFGQVGGVSRDAIARINADGTLDNSFLPSANADIYTTVLQADGKIIIGGAFLTVSGIPRNRIARLESNGDVDPDFNPDANGVVESLALQPDGRVLVGGLFATIGRAPRVGIARLENTEGTQGLAVTAFNRVEWLRGGGAAEVARVDFQFSIDGGGSYTPLGAGTRLSGGWELTGLDLPPSGQVRAQALTANGLNNGSSGMLETVVAFSGLNPVIEVEEPVGVALADEVSAVDFENVNAGSTSPVKTFTIKNSGTGSLVLSGVTVDGTNAGDFMIDTGGMSAALPPGGSTAFTMTFAPNSIGSRQATLHIASNVTGSTNVFDVDIEGQGQQGSLNSIFTSITDVPLTTNGLTATGSTVNLSLGFAPSPFSTLTVVNNTSASPITGTFTNLAQGQTVTLGFGGNDYRFFADYFGGDGNDLVLVLQGPGVLDYSFGTVGKVVTSIGSGSDVIGGAALQPDGKLVVAATAYTGSSGDFAVARYTSSGALDSTFGVAGKITTPVGTGNDVVTSMALQNDGKIIVAGYTVFSSDSDFAMLRYLPDGNLDTSFGTGGKVITSIGAGTDYGRAVAFQNDGKILFAGRSWNGSTFVPVIVRYHADGSVDSSFGSGGFAITNFVPGEALALQSDGKILLAGSGAATSTFAAVRYHADGSLDLSFNGTGQAVATVGSSFSYGRCLAVQPDGKILVGGTSSIGSSENFALARFTSTGAVDLSFGTGGQVVTDLSGNSDACNSMVLMEDGRIVLGGNSFQGASKSFGLARYTKNGFLDTSFGNAGKTSTLFGTIQDLGTTLLMQPDGKLILVGSTQPASTSEFALARYLNDTTLNASFTSKSDVPLSSKALSADDRSLSLSLNYAPTAGTSLKVFNNTGLQPTSGDFTNLAHGQSITLNHSGTDHTFVANYFGGDGNDLVLEWANTKLAAFGANESRQLGITGAAMQANVPTQVVATAAIYQKTILSMSAGEAHSLAVCSDGTVAAWGSNANGQLGNGGTVSATTPVAVTMSGVLSGKRVIAVAAGGQHSLALCSDGTLAAWGDGSFGQIGDGGVLDRTAPVLVNSAGALSGKRVIAISAGANHSAALCSDGTVVCWGGNTNGELGNGSNTQTNVPVAVTTSGVLLGHTVVAIACGQNHTLALLADGAVAAWGANASKQLGNNSTMPSNVPVLVDASGLLNGKRVVRIAAGDQSSLAQCADGALASWGLNDRGQLGVNNATTTFGLAQAVDLSGVLSGKTITGIEMGQNHAAALCSDGSLATWGAGTGGQLGNNAVSDSLVPVAVNGAILGGTDVFVSAASGSQAGHTLAVIGSVTNAPQIVVEHPTGTVLVDGSGSQSFGSTYVTSTKTKVFTIKNAGTQALSGIAATINGTVANIAHYSIPVQPPASLQPGEAASFSVNFTPTSTGSKPVTLRIANNLDAPLNPFDVSLTGTASPSLTFTFTAASDVAVNSAAFNAGSKTITLLLGHAPATGANLMVVNNTGTGFITSAFSNLAHGQTVALTFNSITYNFVANYFGGDGNDLVLHWKDTRLLAWGANSSGTLGTGGTTQANIPAAVSMSGVLNGKTIIAVACGERHTLALCSDNTLAAWGANDLGQMGTGNNTPSNVPVAVPLNGALAGKTIAAIAAGYDISLALCSDGSMAAWGTNSSGQLGNNSVTGSNAPVAVSTAGVLSGKIVTGIAAGYDFAAARCADGTMAAWGANHSGQLGNGTNDDSLVPVAVTASGVLAGRTVTGIAAGNYFVLALCSDGRIAAWGDNGFGTLGDGTVDPSSEPVLVSNTGLFAGKTPVQLGAGQYHSAALCGDGTFGVWGDNTIGPGQLGVSGIDSYFTPGPITLNGVLAGKTLAAFAAGQYHNIALLTDGTLAAWGFSAFGQLGNGSTTFSDLPVLVNLTALGAGERIVRLASGPTALHSTGIVAVPLASGGAPVVSTNAAESINKTSATLKGLVNASGTATTTWFEYGLTTGYGSVIPLVPQSVGSGSTSQTFTQGLAGLVPNTTYHFRIVASNTNGTVTGDDFMFTTLEDPPFATTGSVNVNNITNTTAILPGTVNPNNRATTIYFEFGLTDQYGNTTAPQSIASGSSNVNVTAPVSGLTLGTTYHFRLVAQNSAGTAYGNDAVFTTTSISPPAFNALSASAVTTTGATLNGGVNPNGAISTAYFEYGLTTTYTNVTSTTGIPSGTSTVNVSLPAASLTPGTLYHYRLVAENSAGLNRSADATFTTLPLPPTASTLAAAALSTTSARLHGEVNAQNGSAVVTFEWGTNGTDFPNSLTASPSPVTGSSVTPVSVDVGNLAQFATYHYRVRAVSAGGATTGGVLTFQPAIISGLQQEPPGAPPASSGSLTVTLTPTGLLSGWRFVGEHRWRASGDTATGLVHGSRLIEFRPVPGYLQPGTDTVNITSTGQVADYEYYATPSAGTGGILVVLKPDTLAQAVNETERGQWRLFGETTWRDSGTTVASLPAGSYLVECKTVPGYSTPVLVNVIVSSGGTVNPTIVYGDVSSPIGTAPSVLSFSTVSTDATRPYRYVGQIRSNSGVGTGFAVKSRVVATAGHVVFDEGSLSAAQGLQWLLQEDAGGHEPLPVTPRGYYLIDGYAAQRATEATPGSFSLASRQKDVAALYFINDTDAARSGFAGFLASDLTNNEFLVSNSEKMLVGYPVDGIATLDQGRMHATPAANLSFTGFPLPNDRVFATTGIRSTGGNSGGPLCVQHTNGNWYPAAIYLGGATQSIVRAIDSTVIHLFNSAQQSGIDDQGYTGGGATHSGYNGTTTTSVGAAVISITPAGSGWRPQGSTKSWTMSGNARAGLPAGDLFVEFIPVSGYQTPTNYSINIVANDSRTYDVTFQSSQTPQETWRQTHFGTTANSGNAADDNDYDHDGFTNAEEFAAGTNPTLSGDFFKAENPHRSGGTFTLSTAGRAGRAYALQRSTTMAAGSWTTVDTEGPLGSDGPVSLTDVAAPNDAAFYRIQVTGP